MIVQNIIQKTMLMEQHLDKYRAKHWENKIQRIKFGKLNSQKDLENYDQRIAVRELRELHLENNLQRFT